MKCTAISVAHSDPTAYLVAVAHPSPSTLKDLYLTTELPSRPTATFFEEVEIEDPGTKSLNGSCEQLSGTIPQDEQPVTRPIACPLQKLSSLLDIQQYSYRSIYGLDGHSRGSLQQFSEVPVSVTAKQHQKLLRRVRTGG